MGILCSPLWHGFRNWRCNLFLVASKIDALRPLLLLPEDKKIDVPQLILLAAYGLTYCYVASAPILVFHASRFLFKFRTTKKLRGVGFAVLHAVIIPALFTLALSWSVGGFSSHFQATVALFSSAIVWLQFAGVGYCVFKSKLLYGFYKKLAEARIKAEPLKILNSYRHLREHGNSFFIVVLEIVLAVILLSIGGMVGDATSQVPVDEYYKRFFGVILLWIAPAALVWLVGTIFERRLADDPAL